MLLDGLYLGCKTKSFAGRFLKNVPPFFEFGCELVENLMGVALNKLADRPAGQHPKFLVLLSNVT